MSPKNLTNDRWSCLEVAVRQWRVHSRVLKESSGILSSVKAWVFPPDCSYCLLSTSGGAGVVIQWPTGWFFFMCESVSRGEGWATGREDERGSWREGVTDVWTEVLLPPSLTSSLLVYLVVVRFSMSFKHKLQPVSTSSLLGSPRAPWCSLHTLLFIPPHFPVCEPFLLFLHSFPSRLSPVAPQVCNISHFSLRSCHSIFSLRTEPSSYFAFITFWVWVAPLLGLPKGFLTYRTECCVFVQTRGRSGWKVEFHVKDFALCIVSLFKSKIKSIKMQSIISPDILWSWILSAQSVVFFFKCSRFTCFDDMIYILFGL